MTMEDAIVLQVGLPSGGTASVFVTKVPKGPKARVTLVQEGRAVAFEVSSPQAHEFRKALELTLGEDGDE